MRLIPPLSKETIKRGPLDVKRQALIPISCGEKKRSLLSAGLGFDISFGIRFEQARNQTGTFKL